MQQQEEIASLEREFATALAAVSSSQELEALKVSLLGKKGSLALFMQELRALPPDEKRSLGQRLNDFKESVVRRIDEKRDALLAAEEQSRLAIETLDVTLPGRRHPPGRRHLITQVLDEMLAILVTMGFSVQYGPDIDTDYYNFEALNMGADHPARAMQDTFYITPQVLLRTHTSNVQVRMMEGHPPPLRIVAPGKAFRNEDISARSHVFFHQIEALYVDRDVTFGDLLATMELFLQKLFTPDIEMRVRPSYFPFVEPGMEVDISCLACHQQGCSLCKQSGWLEVAGAGMVHPEVLRAGGIDADLYTGFAWGMGVDRTAMLKYAIPDIRLFTENDLRFLSQF